MLCKILRRSSLPTHRSRRRRRIQTRLSLMPLKITKAAGKEKRMAVLIAVAARLLLYRQRPQAVTRLKKGPAQMSWPFVVSTPHFSGSEERNSGDRTSTDS